MDLVVHVVSLIFIIVAIPVIFCMLTWVAATVYRLYFPEKPLPLESQLSFISSGPHDAPDLAIPVGVREIKEEQRRSQRIEHIAPYSFSCGISNGLPSCWLDDVWLRRN